MRKLSLLFGFVLLLVVSGLALWAQPEGCDLTHTTSVGFCLPGIA